MKATEITHVKINWPGYHLHGKTLPAIGGVRTVGKYRLEGWFVTAPDGREYLIPRDKAESAEKG